MTSYDVIVVGARVAGAATAMLLARRGVKVLLIDRTRFPSDTLSSHQVQVPGIARLHRWGLLGELDKAGTPPTRAVRFDTGEPTLRGHFPAWQGVDTLYSPRRTVLDTVLAGAARAAGADVREQFRAEELVWSGGRVTGIRGSHRGEAAVTETARLVVGADGKHSLVARAVGAASYHQKPVLSFACYSYWSGLPVTGGELYQRPDQPNTFRACHGPGWALVGDAGVVMDSVTAQGITNALRDAELLAGAIVAGLDGARPLSASLAEHQRRRDAAIRPMYDFTVRLARFASPSVAERQLLAAIARQPAEVDRFLGAFAGVLPVGSYFSAPDMLRILGPRGVTKTVAALATHPRLVRTRGT